MGEFRLIFLLYQICEASENTKVNQFYPWVIFILVSMPFQFGLKKKEVSFFIITYIHISFTEVLFIYHTAGHNHF